MGYSPRPATESANYYREGGLHPINIGDTINERYHVRNKLGFGASSTIWLVEDLTLKRFASLKVIAADVSAVSSEIHIARRLKSQQEKPDSHPGKEHVMRIFDAFVVVGPNGTHHCIVAEILGINLVEDVGEFYGDDKGHLPLDVSKRVAAQVALGVAYLHKCGIVHGDLQLKNVLFHSPKLSNASLEELTGIYEEPLLEPIGYRKDCTPVPPSVHLPREVATVPYQLPIIGLCLSSPNDIHVKICDFGEASIYRPKYRIEKPFKTRLPHILAAPEIIFGDITSPAPSMDIWALGVLLYMILHNKRTPFFSESGEDKEVVRWMAVLLGKLPDKWWTRWAERSEYFDDNDVYLWGDTQHLNLNLGGIPSEDYSEEEADAFGGLLGKIFQYEPEDRIDAEEVVRLIPRSWKGCNEKETDNGLARFHEAMNLVLW
ncbi:kinase-like domain-containing protein [Cyathus striatus]|nr:kinase-like domain-containing protein [Cyathus striatus]